ncbi:alpha/beta fold hydrolase [Methanobrevibacter sp. OttesenSCG-928-K11]|nr:alpha/beta fold hydrolase [Methanobrevibacter sp. OttesenSCG-928-K11]MDL2270582.1 alpha/beta fold hydrolase [Methanobrevibacter sp. OttesenSCG-928-I08]
MSSEVFSNPMYHKLKEFKFKSGEILKDAVVEYITLGNPIYDDKGNITNAIVYCHGSSGDFGSIRRIEDLICSDGLLSQEKYFLISLSGLGSPNSSSPSTSNLKSDFPQFTIEDMVNFQKCFLKDKFNINHIKGIIGNSMGGFLALTLVSKYPDFADFAVSLVSSYKVAGHNYAMGKQMNDIILSDPNYNNGNYEKPLTETLKLASKSMYTLGLSREYYRSLSNEEINEGMEELALDGSEDDANDIIYRNNASHSYNIENELSNIKIPVLIIAINQDQYFPPELDAVPMSKMIKNSTLVIYDSILGHIGSSEILKVEDPIKEFLSKVV